MSKETKVKIMYVNISDSERLAYCGKLVQEKQLRYYGFTDDKIMFIPILTSEKK